MGVFKALAVNPNPVANTEDRQFIALDQSGFVIPSHGLAVPTDTPSQPARPYYSSGPGNFTVPRFGWTPAYVIGYAADVAQDLVVVDWKPDDIGMYMFDSYGAIWPAGSRTPIAPTADSGAPFGVQVLPELFGGPAATTTMAGLQMHSGNDKAFGLGGYATGFGWMISMDAMILTWGGPVFGPTQPCSEVTTGWTGTPGSGANVVRDFKVNPDNSGAFYVLFESGYVYSGAGSAIGGAVPVTGAQADGTTGASPPVISLATANGWRWMKVVWGQYIMLVHATGATWGLRLTGGTQTIPPTLAPGGTQTPWHETVAAPYFPGWWQDGDILPASGPAHFWQVNIAGAVQDDVLAGALSITGLTTGGTHTTTTKPTISWTYTETYQVPQKSYSVRVYTQQYITDQGGAFVPGQNAGATEIHDGTSATPNHVITRNLRNGIAFRAYVRVKSAADIQTAWSSLDFTMAIPLPTQPSSCVATPSNGTWPTSMGTVSIAAGGGAPPAGQYLQFQVSALDGPFVDVWQASASSTTPVTDPFPPTNVALVYRVRRIKRVPGLVASAWRTASPVTVSPPGGTPSAYFFIDVGPGAAGPIVILQLEVADRAYVAAAAFTENEPRGSFQTLTQSAKTVTSGGKKGDDHNLTLKSMDTTQYHALRKMLSLTRPIIYMNGFGRSWWVRPAPATWKTLVLGGLPGETTGIRDAHDVTLELENVLPPR